MASKSPKMRSEKKENVEIVSTTTLTLPVITGDYKQIINIEPPTITAAPASTTDIQVAPVVTEQMVEIPVEMVNHPVTEITLPTEPVPVQTRRESLQEFLAVGMGAASPKKEDKVTVLSAMDVPKPSPAKPVVVKRSKPVFLAPEPVLELGRQNVGRRDEVAA